MTAAFSKILAASEGRFLTLIEEEQSLVGSMELKQRMMVSRMLEQNEYSIVDFATHAFCDVVPEFESPKGSIRRKKGHQDGRIMLRFISQAVREGSSEIFFEKVLSWLIGHLDERNVSGQHMEVFCHFLHQGARRELPQHLYGFIDTTFEEVVNFIRRASHSGSILRAHRRVAEFAVKRVMDILPEVKAKYGVSSMPKCKRDFELVVKEIARVMKTGSYQETNEQFAAWLVDRLMNQVAYDANVWHWSFLALREGIVHCCGPAAATAASPLLDAMAENAPRLIEAVELASAAGDIACSAADYLIEMGEPLGLLRKDEFKTIVSMVNRELIVRLAVLGACGDFDAMSEKFAQTWCDEVLTKLPSRTTAFLAANLKAILEATKKQVGESTAESFRDAVMRLVAVARRVETAERLSAVCDDIATEVTDWACDTMGASARASRACFRDIRLALARIINLLPSGPSSVNGHRFRAYLVQYVLPSDPATPQVMEQTYRKLAELVGNHLQSEDARLVQGYIEDAIGCFSRYDRLRAIRKNIDHFTVSAVERGYQAAPRHESLSRHGIDAGRRDGAFLLEKAVEAAVVSGQSAEALLHEYFMNEQVRLSKLPGGVVVEFVRGLQEQVRDYPEVVELMVGIAKAAPAYTSSIKINLHSQDLAEQISRQVMSSSPGYRERVGEHGLEACVRDNAVMLRGLAHFMNISPLDTVPFREWWLRSIGKNIRNKPEAADSSDIFAIINVKGLIYSLQSILDVEELNYVNAYMSRVVNPEGAEVGIREKFASASVRAVTDFGITAPLSFSDVGV